MMGYEIANNQINAYIDELLEQLYKRDMDDASLDQGYKGLKGQKGLRRR